MSLTWGILIFTFIAEIIIVANFVLYKEAIHLQGLLREWAWST